MKVCLGLSSIVALGVLAFTPTPASAQVLQPTSTTYTWSGELVSFDANSRNMTVKTSVVGDQAVTELKGLKAGDRVVLTWCGFDRYADGIWRVARYDASKKWNEPFMLPVEFVAYEADRNYATFRFKVPAASVNAVSHLKPG